MTTMLSVYNRFAFRVLGFMLGVCIVGGCMRCNHALDEGDPVIAGWKHFQLGEFDQAVTVFESVCAGDSDEVTDATYGLAAVWDLRLPVTGQDKKLAESLYRKVAEGSPDHRLAPWSMLAIARIKHLVPIGHEPDYDEVRKAYAAVWEKYP